MVTAKEARAVARRMLRENIRLFILSYLSYLGLTLAAVFAEVLFVSNSLAGAFWSFASLFLLIPLALGLLHIHNLVYYKRRCSLGNLFDFYRNYGVSIKALGVSYIFSLMFSVILVPALVVVALPLALSAPADGTAWSGVLILAAVAIFAAVLAISMLAQSFVTACYFIVLRNRSIPFGRLLGSSLKIGGRYLLRFFLLQLSFFGWGLLCFVPFALASLLYFWLVFRGSLIASGLALGIGLLIFGIALFVLTAYINAASTVFFNVAIDEYEREYPDFAQPAAMPAPPAPGAPGQGPADRYAGPAGGQPAASPLSPPMPEQPQSGAPGAQEPASDPKQAPPVEKMEAEIIEPQENGLCDVILVSPGVGRMLVTMIIRDLTGMELDEARRLVESAPKAVFTGISQEEAREAAKRLTEAGARVEIR